MVEICYAEIVPTLWEGQNAGEGREMGVLENDDTRK